ncbi:MAG: hypothetical protein LBG59_07775 [Candidatus Peribacteria bacterium]|jgi:hypothetical protein|nr:hypothetical protein [Candidatus Peribacteria bacterium]
MNIYDYDSMTEEEFGNEKFSKEKVQELYTTVQKQLEQGIRETEEQKILTFLLKRRDETYDTTLPTVVEETSLLTMVGGPMKYLAGVDASHNFKNDLHLKEGKLKTTIGTVIRTDIYIDYSKKGDTRIYVSDFLNKKGGN